MGGDNELLEGTTSAACPSWGPGIAIFEQNRLNAVAISLHQYVQTHLVAGGNSPTCYHVVRVTARNWLSI